MIKVEALWKKEPVGNDICKKENNWALKVCPI